jgi:hypothetical protein
VAAVDSGAVGVADKESANLTMGLKLWQFCFHSRRLYRSECCKSSQPSVFWFGMGLPQ